MVNTENILARLDEIYEEERKLNERHKRRVKEAVDWWNKNALSNSEKFIGEKVLVNDIECFCVEVNLQRRCGVYFKVKPYKRTDDAGSGAGETHTIDFK